MIAILNQLGVKQQTELARLCSLLPGCRNHGGMQSRDLSSYGDRTDAIPIYWAPHVPGQNPITVCPQCWVRLFQAPYVPGAAIPDFSPLSRARLLYTQCWMLFSRPGARRPRGVHYRKEQWLRDNGYDPDKLIELNAKGLSQEV